MWEINHEFRAFDNFDCLILSLFINLEFFPENITAKLGFKVKAITREARSVIVIIKGIENIKIFTLFKS